jgi:hypothetical protein
MATAALMLTVKDAIALLTTQGLHGMLLTENNKHEF